MYLKSIELSGFKSFAKKSAIEFKSSVTAIVGPNGSGKSNVAEAFRFVLGEQSIKSMRGKKGEDLIWNGSEEVSRANRAHVKTVFNNEKKLFPIDYDEVSVERVVNRDGSNEYSINGTQVRLKDIMELLGSANIGATGHHIISQGEADRILSASIKERRSMIEEALGLKVYQYKRQESERKLLKTSENILQVESLRREIAPHLKFLKKQVEKLSRAASIREELTKFYREYLKREKIYLDVSKSAIHNDRKPLEEKLESLKRMNEEARAILESSEKRDSKSDELLNLENEQKKSRENKDQLEREAGRIEGEISANVRSIENLVKRQESNEHKTVRLKDVDNFHSDILNNIKEVEEENNIFVLKKILSSIKEKISQFILSNRDVTDTSAIEEIRNHNEELKKKINDIESKIKIEESKLNELNVAYSQIRAQLEKDKDSSRAAEKELFRISSERALVESELHIIKAKEERLKIEQNDWNKEAEEGAVLLGNLILGFQNDELKDLDGNIISEEQITKEDRVHQEERRREIEKRKIRLEELGAGGGEDVLKEYNDTNERDSFLEKELNDLKISSDSLKKLIQELEEKLNVEFKEGIEKINQAFNNFFSLMFGGGSAKLEIVEARKTKRMEEESEENDQETETEEGIDINVSLPRKRIKGLNMLSGGERALTSIALLFAMSQVNPPPFIILDETDAALDEANSKKYGDMIESLSKYSQLIIITHNRETMSRAGVIYGVTMGSNGISKLLSIAFDEAVSVAK